jgi:hypothetical protein
MSDRIAAGKQLRASSKCGGGVRGLSRAAPHTEEQEAVKQAGVAVAGAQTRHFESESMTKGECEQPQQVQAVAFHAEGMRGGKAPHNRAANVFGFHGASSYAHGNIWDT